MLAFAITRAETLKIAAYNVENYVAADRLVEGKYRQNYPKPEGERDALRAVIRNLDADVLAVEEMGPKPYLEELRHDLAQEGLNYPFAQLLEAADVDRHLAVLSKRKFTAVHGHDDLNFGYFGATEKVKRGLLEVRFATEGGEITLFVVHLKSRLTDRADDPESALRRAGEATAVRDEILRLFPDPASSRFLVMGDFNDARGSKPLRLLTQRGKTTITELLPAADTRGEIWTHFYRKEETYSKIDHVLVSPGLKPNVVGAAARICDLPETRMASDHRPVVVTLTLVKAK